MIRISLLFDVPLGYSPQSPIQYGKVHALQLS